MKLFSSCIVLIVLAAVNAKWTECDGGTKIKSVICNGKDMKTTAVCDLKKGQNSDLTVVFQADADMKNLTAVCHGIIGSVSVPFSGIEKDSCKQITPGCPLVAGKTYTYKTEIFVKTIYPALKLLIKWEEQKDDKNGEDEWCLIIPAMIVS